MPLADESLRTKIRLSELHSIEMKALSDYNRRSLTTEAEIAIESHLEKHRHLLKKGSKLPKGKTLARRSGRRSE